MATKNSDFDFGLDAVEILAKGKKSQDKRIDFGKATAQLRHLAAGSPEVVVKISGGGKSIVQVFNHMTYITRNGTLEATTENGDKVSSHEEIKELIEEWGLNATRRYGEVKLAYNIVLSMPQGTPAEAVQEAAAKFALDSFWSNHRYLMVLHTDRPHPHVHIVVKAEGEDRARMDVRKEMLEDWRQTFAEKLNEIGIMASATHRDVRGQSLKSLTLPVYHLEKRGASKVLQAKVAQVAKQLLASQQQEKEPWTQAMAQRREKILELFKAASETLRASNEPRLADDLEKFARELPAVVTRNELISKRLKEIILEGRKNRALTSQDLADAMQKVSRTGPVEQPAKETDKVRPEQGKTSTARKKDIERE